MDSKKGERAVEEKVKQRLIGIIVIIAALFVVIPFLLHNSHPSIETKLSTTAPASSVSVALPAAQPATNAAPTSTPAPAPAATQTTPNTASQTSAPSTAATTPATPSTTQTSFNASPNALTTGQANEGPAQPASTPAAVAVAQPATPTTTAAAQPQPTQPQQPLKQAQIQPKAPAAPVQSAQPKPQQHASITKRAHHASPAVGAWEIQLAAFSDKAYAAKLVAKLHAHHFPVYTRRLVVNDRTLTAVFVGPETSFNQAEITRQRLKQTVQLNGVIQKHRA